ncbi:TPA: hypothetical protein ACH3X2_008144 [Trebouxia sp. C0005]
MRSQIRHQSESQLMDLDALTSASEFHMTDNAWMANIDAEQRQATTIPAYQNTEAATKDTLSNIFAPALLPLLDDDSNAFVPQAARLWLKQVSEARKLVSGTSQVRGYPAGRIHRKQYPVKVKPSGKTGQLSCLVSSFLSKAASRKQ